MRTKWNKFTTLAILLGVLGCGGSGGEVAGPPELPERPEEPTDPYAREYASQSGLAMVNASAMHERGGTGQGVQIAIIDSDSNPDHPELMGKYDILEHAPLPPRHTGHGGRVAAVMVARRDGQGMHGVAYNATLVAYETRGTQASSGLTWLNGQDVKLTNISAGATDSIIEAVRDGTTPAVTSADSRWRSEARTYVESGGVIVYSAGNNGDSEVNATAGAPYVAPELEQGWLAVAGLGTDGAIYRTSNRCGVAAAWCLAAPGARIYTIDEDSDGYSYQWGTSLAAPHVTGGIAGLKSLFPNLSFQDLRARVLHTANRTGRYANEAVYGQGLLDLDAASRPVGGMHFASAPNDGESMHSTRDAGVQIGQSFTDAIDGEQMLLFDGFQRAPFAAGLGSFVSERTGLVSFEDLGLDQDMRRPAVPEQLEQEYVRSFSGGNLATNLGAGTTVEHGNYRLPGESVGMAFGFGAGDGTVELAWATRQVEQPGGPRAGIEGWTPETVIAATFVPIEGNASFGASLAMGLTTPGGMSGRGALETRGRAIDVGYRRTVPLGENTWAELGGRLAHLKAGAASQLVRRDKAWIAGWSSKVTFELAKRTWLATGVEIQRSLGNPDTWLRAASTIEESGAIGYRDIRIDDGALSDIDRASVQLVHETSEGARIGLGAVVARDRAGTTDAMAGIRYHKRF